MAIANKAYGGSFVVGATQFDLCAAENIEMQ
jgi:hypothetical protein